MEGNWHFERAWTSLIAGSKFTVFALSLRALFSKYKPPGGLYLERPFNRGFFPLRVWELIFGGAYTWRGLFLEFYGISTMLVMPVGPKYHERYFYLVK